MYFWTAYNSGFNIPGQIVKARYNWQDARSGWALWFTAHGPLIIQGSWQTEWNWRLSLLSLRCKSWEGDFYCPLDVLLWSQGSIVCTFPPISWWSSDSLRLSEEGGGSVRCLRGLYVCVGGDFGFVMVRYWPGGPAFLFKTDAAIAVLQKVN